MTTPSSAASSTFPTPFIPLQPIYIPGTSTMNESWRQFFQQLWLRTGGNVNSTITTDNVTDIINNMIVTTFAGLNTPNVAQQVSDIQRQLAQLSAQSTQALAVAIQAISSETSGLTAGQVMAYSTLGVA